MSLFDFVADEGFRRSLEADYAEVEHCIAAKAWKAIYVISGSIIEALLLDYLVATNYEVRRNRKLSKLTLYDIIKICEEEEKILSETSAQFSHAVRNYRNLIHPEKAIRIKEKVSENGAVIVKALVDMVIQEVSEDRSRKMGYTAEQLIKKIENDIYANPILEELVARMSHNEQEKLLTKLLEERYLSLKTEIWEKEDEKVIVLENLEECFAVAFNASPEELKTKVAKRFIEVIEKENTAIVDIYEERFFRSEFLDFFRPRDRELFKRHFLTRLSRHANKNLIETAKGLGKYLNEKDVLVFINGFIQAIAVYLGIEEEEEAERILLDEFFTLNASIQEVALDKINEWGEDSNLNEYGYSVVARIQNKVRVRKYTESALDFDPFLDSDDLP